MGNSRTRKMEQGPDLKNSIKAVNAASIERAVASAISSISIENYKCEVKSLEFSGNGEAIVTLILSFVLQAIKTKGPKEESK